MKLKKRRYWHLSNDLSGGNYVKGNFFAASASRTVTITVTNFSLSAAGINDSGFFSGENCVSNEQRLRCPDRAGGRWRDRAPACSSPLAIRVAASMTASASSAGIDAGTRVISRTPLAWLFSAIGKQLTSPSSERPSTTETSQARSIRCSSTQGFLPTCSTADLHPSHHGQTTCPGPSEPRVAVLRIAG